MSAISTDESSPDNEAILGSGIAAAEPRSLPPFQRIDLDCSAKVVLTFGEDCQVTVSADDNLVELVGTRVEAGTLRIGTQGAFAAVCSMIVHVTMPVLTHVRVQSFGKVDMRHPELDSLDLRVRGDGDIRAYGAGRIDRLVVNVKGDGEVRLPSVTARAAEISLVGSGAIEVTVSQDLDATLQGSGSIRVGGAPAKRRVSRWGSGELRIA